MNQQVEFEFDYSGFVDYLQHLQKRVKEPIELVKAVRDGGNYINEKWIKNAESKFKHSKGGYARGVREGTNYPHRGDPLVFNTTHPSKIAVYLERGYEAFDLKKMLSTSLKVKVSKKGKRYLIIPFEHGTPGSKTKRAMPKEVHEEAKKLKPSFSTDVNKRGSETKASTYKDAMLMKEFNPKRVTQRGYEWGDRLKDVDQPKLKSKTTYHRIFDEDNGKYKRVSSGPHKTNPYEGMVKFETNPNLVRQHLNMGKFEGSSNKTGNMQSSGKYMTFRIMHEDQNGWIHPGLSPMNILGEVLESGKPQVEKMVAEAAKRDMQKAIEMRGEGII